MPLQLGLVREFDSRTGIGVLINSEGSLFRFDYASGQSVVASDDLVVPMLSGNHDQPSPCRLKEPMAGDLVLFREGSNVGSVAAWGYACNFLAAAERRFGTNFATPENFSTLVKS